MSSIGSVGSSSGASDVNEVEVPGGWCSCITDCFRSCFGSEESPDYIWTGDLIHLTGDLVKEIGVLKEQEGEIKEKLKKCTDEHKSLQKLLCAAKATQEASPVVQSIVKKIEETKKKKKEEERLLKAKELLKAEKEKEIEQKAERERIKEEGRQEERQAALQREQNRQPTYQQRYVPRQNNRSSSSQPLTSNRVRFGNTVVEEAKSDDEDEKCSERGGSGVNFGSNRYSHFQSSFTGNAPMQQDSTTYQDLLGLLSVMNANIRSD